MRFRLLAATAMALPLLVAGCKVNTINSFNASPAMIRVANVVPDAPAIAVSVDGTQYWNGVTFEAVTGYQTFDANIHNFAFRVDGTTTDLVNEQFNIAGQQSYTLLTFGTVGAPAELMVPDVVSDPGAGASSVRFVNAAAGSIGVDIYLLPPDQLIANVNPTVSFLLYGASGPFTTVPTGVYRATITFAGTKTVLYDSGVITLLPHGVINAIIYTRGSSSLVNLLVLDTAGGTRILNNIFAFVKALNAAPGYVSVDLYVDGNKTLPTLLYGTASAYIGLAATSLNFAFEPTTAPGTIIAQTTGQLTPAMDTTAILLGLSGQEVAVLYPDNNLTPVSGYSRIRFINASSGGPPLDVQVNGVTAINALASPNASVYVPLASGTYTFTFVDPTGKVVATLANTTLGNTNVYTACVIGPANSLQAVLSTDR